VNACYSKLRHEGPRRSRRAGDDSVLDHLAAAGPTPEAAAASTDTARRVGDALADLPEHLRVVVVLRYWSELSEREIATAIRRRPGTVKSRLNDARRRLALDRRMAALVADGVASGGQP